MLNEGGQLTSEDCPSAFQQCAGKRYDGRQNCCAPGLECAFSNEWYSQCLPNSDAVPVTPAPVTEPDPEPVPDPEPEPVVEPDPGMEPPTVPKPEPQPKSVPDSSSDCPGPWNQCGGDSFQGIQNCCSEGSVCTFQNKWYSQCQLGMSMLTIHSLV